MIWWVLSVNTEAETRRVIYCTLAKNLISCSYGKCSPLLLLPPSVDRKEILGPRWATNILRNSYKMHSLQSLPKCISPPNWKESANQSGKTNFSTVMKNASSKNKKKTINQVQIRQLLCPTHNDMTIMNTITPWTFVLAAVNCPLARSPWEGSVNWRIIYFKLACESTYGGLFEEFTDVRGHSPLG